jgi:hypothetical protein
MQAQHLGGASHAQHLGCILCAANVVHHAPQRCMVLLRRVNSDPLQCIVPIYRELRLSAVSCGPVPQASQSGPVWGRFKVLVVADASLEHCCRKAAIDGLCCGSRRSSVSKGCRKMAAVLSSCLALAASSHGRGCSPTIWATTCTSYPCCNHLHKHTAIVTTALKLHV